jgi:hypothetical protein
MLETKTDIEKELDRQILLQAVKLLRSINDNTRPKTSAEMIDELRSVSTKEEWANIVKRRVMLASLAECADGDAQAKGFRDYDDMVEKTQRAKLHPDHLKDPKVCAQLAKTPTTEAKR